MAARFGLIASRALHRHRRTVSRRSVSSPPRRPATNRCLRNADPTATPPWPRQAVTRVSTPRICLSVNPIAPPVISQLRMTPRRTGSGSAVKRSGVEPVVGRGGAHRLIDQRVDQLGVRAKRGRGAGQRLGHSSAEHLLQQRQHLVAQPAAGETPVGVVRVMPGAQAQLRARGMGDLATHPQQRPTPGRVVGAHTGDRPCTGAATQSEQHGFGLVVESVRQQHRPVVTGVGQCPVAGITRRGFRTTLDRRPRRKELARQRIPIARPGAGRWLPPPPSRAAIRGRRSVPWSAASRRQYR